MQTNKNYGALDVFRVIAAFLVVAIHTSPLTSFSAEADFFLTRVVARLAVPFFFLVTGYFVLGKQFAGRYPSPCLSSVSGYLRKILVMYGAAILIYIPIGIYAGHYKELSASALLRMLIFDGTFYHLWYFSALILGILLLCFLRRFLSARACTAAVFVLYVLGLLGDSYWGLIEHVPGISAAYEWCFQIFSYTRNGIFLAPLFLWMGARIAGQQIRPTDSRIIPAAGFALTLALMTAEGFLLRYFEWQRHDSMYLLLPVCAYFLYRLLLTGNIPSKQRLRAVSSWIYILHPALIVLLRGIAKPLHATTLLVDNSLIHYLIVCLLSAAAAYAVTAFLNHVCPPVNFYPMDRAWLEIDRNALKHNVSALRSLLPKTCELMPAIKADAYGHGAVPVAQELNRLGVDSFCVACISEGIELRKNGVQGEILILGYTHPKQFPLLRRYHLTQTVIDFPYALEMNRFGKKLKGHIAVDTGMHRLGERCDHMEHFIRLLSMKNLTITGAMTHLCSVDSNLPESREFTRQQAEAFYRVIKAWKKRGFTCPKIHLQSSYGVLNYPELAGDYARVGIALYGVHSAREDYDASSIQLKPVLSWKARVAVVKELLPGEGAGYGLTFTADSPMKIATLSVGYGDGLPRSLSSGVGSVLIRGQRAAIIGRICMDQTIVDVTEIPGIRAGDEAVLLGQSGSETITACDLAEQSGTITNEILSRLGARMPRIMI
ncbi:MAG: serine racemase VanT catalytic subunit [Lachnospiraceae bacterium]|nr:serine racemase VanT catalytic subunit [Lachnospiraceae bacterium]